MRHQVAISTAIDEFLLRGLKMYLMSIREFAPGMDVFRGDAFRYTGGSAL